MGMCFCKNRWRKKSIQVHQSKNKVFNILLLGLENAGKTEIGSVLVNKPRRLHEPTNGVQCYRLELPNCSIFLTEIGGSPEMFKLWPYYYAKTMGLIFCYDMSTTLQEMQKSFVLFDEVTSHPYMRGKAVLLVGTKSDLVSDTVQLYDIENAFALESLANQYTSSLKSIHFNPREVDSLWSGIDWLVLRLESNYNRINARIKNDTISQHNHKKPKSRKKRFNLSFRRPKTAPANLAPNCIGSPAAQPNATGQLRNDFRCKVDSSTTPLESDMPNTSKAEAIE